MMTSNILWEYVSIHLKRKTIMNRQGLFFIFYLFFGCAHQLPSPELKKIRSWSEELQATYPQVPFKKEYIQSKKKLIFIAADHSRNVETPTHQLIKTTINEFNPDLLIIEGIQTSEGVNPSKILTYLNSKPKEMNEGSYGVSLLNLGKSHFMGGEISNLEVKEFFKDSSTFTSRDLVCFLLLRGIAGINQRERNISLTQAMNKIYSYIEESYQLKKDEIVHEKEFKEWVLKSTKKEFNLSTISTMDVAPLCHLEATVAQKINCEINKLRNAHLVNLIHQCFLKHEKVLVVYGAGHLVQIEESLKSFLNENPNKCLGQNDAKMNVIYFHGMDTNKSSDQELKNQKILLQLAESYNLKLFLPRASKKCPTNDALLCWGWKFDREEVNEVLSEVNKAKINCLNKDLPLVLIGFSNGGHLLLNGVAHHLVSGLSEKLIKTIIVGAVLDQTKSNLINSSNVKMTFLVGNRDHYNYEKSKTLKLNPKNSEVIYFNGGHEIEKDSMTMVFQSVDR